MAFLEEIEVFEPGIYQWETTDPLIGGPNGIDNVPTKQLANRTKWLKAAVDSIMGVAFEAAKAVKLKTPRKINGVDFDGTADINITVDMGSNIHAATVKATPIDTDELGVWDSVSNALRKVTFAGLYTTLKARFDAYMAPLDSPAFTNNPTVPTQAAGDNSTRIINSLWAKLGLAYSLGANGYIKLPDWMGGWIFQWVVGANSGAIGASSNVTVNITLPLAFPNTCFLAISDCDGINSIKTSVASQSQTSIGVNLVSTFGTYSATPRIFVVGK